MTSTQYNSGSSSSKSALSARRHLSMDRCHGIGMICKSSLEVPEKCNRQVQTVHQQAKKKLVFSHRNRAWLVAAMRWLVQS
jgi:hypothetical protein